MSQKTIDEWEADTPEHLPERMKKAQARSESMGEMKGFWAGFYKRASATYASAKPPVAAAGMQPDAEAGAPEKMLKWNELGGVDPRSPEDMAAAETASLVTLPREVEGASCKNCVHFRALSPELGSGFCTNPAVKQDVTERMLCSAWEHPGSYSAAEAAAAEQMAQQQAQQQAVMSGEATAEGDPMAQQIMQDFQGGGEVPGQPAPSGAEMGSAAQDEASGPSDKSKAKAEKKPTKKDKPETGGSANHTINISVGGKEKAEKKAHFLRGFFGRVT
ncbi:MAG: hypothetical protein MUP21_06820 [Dehalococcoidia bacterium]|nr:hypothetical protein [Dehalococcoidia bacterium]